MPVVHVPSSLRALTSGRASFEVAGATLGQVFAALGRECPDLVARVIADGAVREDMAIAIDGSILEGGELLQEVAADAEIYLVPPIGGGAAGR
jgi:molybdopterin converting factor small subunit